jgi:hypothetical protein
MLKMLVRALSAKIGLHREVVRADDRSSWRAVSISVGPAPCISAKRSAARRWLPSQAPKLPMPGCDAATCNCRYRHHLDRRSRPRRKDDRDQCNRRFAGTDRRNPLRGRRSEDRQVSRG